MLVLMGKINCYDEIFLVVVSRQVDLTLTSPWFLIKHVLMTLTLMLLLNEQALIKEQGTR